MSAEKRYDVECKSSGSRPEASLTWWKGSRQIKRMAKNVCRIFFYSTKNRFSSCVFLQFSETGNQTLSVLTFIPVVDDDGKYLTCRAENAFIPDSAIEDKWRLVVHCKFFFFLQNLHFPRSIQNMTFHHQHRYRRMKIMNPFNFALLLVAIHAFFCEASLNDFIQKNITTASTITLELHLN